MSSVFSNDPISSQFCKELNTVVRKYPDLNNVLCVSKLVSDRVALRAFVNSKPDAEQILISIVRNKNEYSRKILKWLLKRKLK